jgi:hypothetical protein
MTAIHTEKQIRDSVEILAREWKLIESGEASSNAHSHSNNGASKNGAAGNGVSKNSVSGQASLPQS